MKYLEITTNIGCTNNCSYCPQKVIINRYSQTKGPIMMSFNTFKKCIDKTPKETSILFCGMSEPFLNPNCTKMIFYANKQKHPIQIYTTLVGMKLSDIDYIERMKSSILIVIHIPADNLEKINIDKNYLFILNEILKSKIKLQIHTNGNNINPKIKRIVKYNINLVQLQNRAGNLKTSQKIEKKIQGKIFCERQLSYNVLLPNGDVLLCCQDYGMKHVLGNLLTNSYESLFKSKEFIKIKNGLQNEKIDILCRQCQAYAYPIPKKTFFEKINIFLKKIHPRMTIKHINLQ